MCMYGGCVEDIPVKQADGSITYVKCGNPCALLDDPEDTPEEDEHICYCAEHNL